MLKLLRRVLSRQPQTEPIDEPAPAPRQVRVEPILITL